MAPANNGGEKKKGHSAVHEEVTRDSYTIDITSAQGLGVKKRAPRALRGIQKFARKETGTQMLAPTPGSARLSGPKEGGMPLPHPGAAARKRQRG